MNIRLITKPVRDARLTGGRKQTTVLEAGETVTGKANPPEDTISLSSFDDRGSLQARLFSSRKEIAAQKRYLSRYEHVPNQVLVRLKSDVSALGTFAQDYQSEVLHHFDLTGLKTSVASSEHLMLLELNDQLDVAEAMVLMAKDERVSVVESNDILRAQVVDSSPAAQPNDLEAAQWGLYNSGQSGGIAGVDIGAKVAWEANVGSRNGPIVAVIDSGIDYTHPDLKANIFVNPGEIPNDGIDNDGNGVIDDVIGYNAAAGSNDPKDDNGHGTHCAGIIGAVGNNGQGITGVNQEARILPIRFLDAEGAGDTANALKSLLYATRTGARVVNNSWGGNKYNQLMFDVLADSEALFVCAAGNEAYDNDVRNVYPAGYELDNVLSVTAHDRRDQFPKFANRGETTVDLAAPGVDIYSTFKGGKYETMSGTSMAAPHVTGAATLIATAVPGISNEDLKFRLMNNLVELPEKYGSRIVSGGRLNIGKALEQDDIAPSPVGDLRSESITAQDVKVSWIAPGDDGDEGQLSGYEVRYTLGEFQSPDAKEAIPFEEARRLYTGKPGQAGSREEIFFSLTPSGTLRHLSLGVVGIDNVNNKGPLQTLKIEVPAAKVAVEDRGESNQETAFLPSDHWSKVPEPGRGMVYTDSPEGDYPSDRDAILEAKPFSLKGFRKPVLHFDSKIDVEKKHDSFTVEVEKDGWFGKKWVEIARFDGLSDWQSHQLSLSAHSGQDDVKLRFRLQSDRDRNRDGVYLDNIVVAESPH